MRSGRAWWSGIFCSPQACMAWWIVGAGLGPGLTETAGKGSRVLGRVWTAVVAVCWGADGGSLGDGDVDEGLVGVVLCGPLPGGGSCRGQGGSGRGGRGVLVAGAFLWVLMSPLL